jgi:phosphate/sulfate permease
MSPGAGVALMMNNYFHDVATALLAASAVALWVMLRRYEAGPRGPDAARYFLELQAAMAKLARFSLAWIVLGGIPRTIWYGEFEWANAAGRAQVTALVVKHVVALALVIGGAVFWRRLARRVAAVRGELDALPPPTAARGRAG